MSRQSTIRWNPIRSGWLVGVLFAAGCFESPSVPDHSPAASQSPAASPAAATRRPHVDIAIREPYIIEVTGDKYRWQVKYPGADGMPATADDVLMTGNIHVPSQTDVELVLKSADYVYSVAVPHFQLHEMAVPKLEFRLKFHPTEAGRFEWLGDEFCGDPHPELTGTLFVEPPDRFREWLSEQKSHAPVEVSP
jgi:heme/copper-type cytochrome/quinol oxidase subunit 2